MAVEWTWLAVDEGHRVMVLWTAKRGAYPAHALLVEALDRASQRELEAVLELHKPYAQQPALHFSHPMEGTPDTYDQDGGRGALKLSDLPASVQPRVTQLALSAVHTRSFTLCEYIPREQLEFEGEWSDGQDDIRRTVANLGLSKASSMDTLPSKPGRVRMGRPRLKRATSTTSAPKPTPTIDRRPPRVAPPVGNSDNWLIIARKTVAKDANGLGLHTTVTREDFEKIRTLTGLTVLDLAHADFDPSHLARLATLTKLTKLVLTDTPTADIHLGFLRHLPHLKELRLEETRATEACKQHLCDPQQTEVWLKGLDWASINGADPSTDEIERS